MSKDKNPKRTAVRETKQRRRLPPGAVCIACGENDPRVLELHHVMGRAHEPDLTVVLCKNCHGKGSERQLQEEVPLNAADNFHGRITAILEALAAFFRFLADSFDRLVEQAKAHFGSSDVARPACHAALSEGD